LSRYLRYIFDVPGTKKPYHHGELRQTLLAAVDQLVRTKGADAVTLRECARIAGVSHAAPLHHFRDHQALLAAYVAEQWIAVAERMEVRRAKANSDPFAQLVAVGMAYIESGMRTPGLFNLLLRPDLAPPPESEGFEQGSKPAHDQLVNAVRLSTGGSANDALIAELCWSSVHGFVELQQLLGIADWEQKAEAMLDLLRPVLTSCNGPDPHR
jgi:AcrR family transcriptional regulator